MIKSAFVYVLAFYSLNSFSQALSPLQIYDDAIDITTKNFYDQTFRGLDWPKLTSQYRQELTNSSKPIEVQAVINGLLDNLHASHTEFVTADEQEYHALRCIFSMKIETDPYFQSGGWFQKIDGKWFVRDVFVGSPLARAGVVSGDEIISVDGKTFTEIRSFNTPSPVKVQYRHDQSGPELNVVLTSEKKSVQELLLDATNRSQNIFLLRNKKVGYFHLWSGTHERFLESIQGAVKALANSTDVMVLDLRDGFGGAGPEYVQSFFDHDLETGVPVAQIYSKPVYMLINEGVRSGKEYLALLFKNEKRGVLVGTNTAGHYLGGRLYNIVDGLYALYLAVAGDPTGELEGRGVPPDIQVVPSLPYSKGQDVQLETTLSLIR